VGRGLGLTILIWERRGKRSAQRSGVGEAAEGLDWEFYETQMGREPPLNGWLDTAYGAGIEFAGLHLAAPVRAARRRLNLCCGLGAQVVRPTKGVGVSEVGWDWPKPIEHTFSYRMLTRGKRNRQAAGDRPEPS
jgi:hypothetical protein